MIVAGTLLLTLVGLAYSLLAPKVYMVRAVIYPQDVSASNDKPAFGGLSGALNPLIGAGHLNRVEIILKSRELARQVIFKNHLIPVLFPGDWSPSKEADPATINSGINRLHRMVSTKVDVYKVTLEIKTQANDAKVAFRITQAYLEALNERMKENVVRNADENRDFLETQMSRTADPWSKEKIQELIIREIERTMLLNANAFEVLEAPEVPLMREAPKRKQIVMMSALLGFLVSCGGLLAARALRNLKAEAKSSGN